MPSAALLGISGWRHKRSWRVRVKVPTVAILGFSMFSFLFLVWGPMQLDCHGKQGASSGDGRKEVQVGPWGLASGALDARVVMEMLETQSTSSSSGFETGRRKVLAVVGLHTGFDALQRRKSLRETWVPATPEGSARQQEATGVVVKFVIGWTSDAVKMATVEEEAEVFKDFLLLDTEESAQMRTVKPLAYFKAAYKLFDADFYVKADDNIYLRPDRLSTLLAKDRSSPRTYLGCMKNGIVVQDPKHKWYEPLSGLLGKEYFHHAYGAIYALSAEVVATLAAARDGSLRMFSNDDVTIGAWMLAMNVEYEDNRALCDSECHNNSVAVWDIPKCSGLCDATVQLPELHNLDICSNSPTLPDA